MAEQESYEAMGEAQVWSRGELRPPDMGPSLSKGAQGERIPESTQRIGNHVGFGGRGNEGARTRTRTCTHTRTQTHTHAHAQAHADTDADVDTDTFTDTDTDTDKDTHAPHAHTRTHTRTRTRTRVHTHTLGLQLAQAAETGNPSWSRCSAPIPSVRDIAGEIGQTWNVCFCITWAIQCS